MAGPTRLTTDSSMPSISCSASASPERAARRVGIGNQPAHDGDALDQLGDALQEQEEEAERTSNLAGQCGRPPALDDCSLMRVGAREERPAVNDHHQRERQQEEQWPNTSIQLRTALGQRVVHDVDADVLVLQQV